MAEGNSNLSRVIHLVKVGVTQVCRIVMSLLRKYIDQIEKQEEQENV